VSGASDGAGKDGNLTEKQLRQVCLRRDTDSPGMLICRCRRCGSQRPWGAGGYLCEACLCDAEEDEA